MTPLDKLTVGIRLVIDAEHEIVDGLTASLARGGFESPEFAARFLALGESLELLDVFLAEQGARLAGMVAALDELRVALGVPTPRRSIQ